MSSRNPPESTPAVTLHWQGRQHAPPDVAPAELRAVQSFLPTPDADTTNALYHGDNLPILAALRERGEQFDLIYADPPYDSGVSWARRVRLRGRSAGRAVLTRIPEYGDSFGDAGYLQFMQDRLHLLRDLLAPTGTLWLHCDHRHAHHLRLLLDEIMGSHNWLNTLAWRSQTARGAKSAARYFPYSAHTIHIFAKDAAAKPTWNAPKRRILLSEKEAAALFMRDEKGFFRTSDPGDYTYDSLLRLHAEGRLYAPYGGTVVIDATHRRIYASHGGNIGVKYYLAAQSGGKFLVERAVDNLWEDIPGLGTTPGEDTGYPTQKTEALLERVIATATNLGDRVLDPFSGSGTTAAVAQRLGRRWSAIDASARSIQLTTQRLYEIAANPEIDALTQPGFTLYQQVTDAADDTANPPAQEAQQDLSPEPALLITRNALDATRIHIDVIGWRSPKLLALLKQTDGNANVDWRSLIDAIEIDLDYRADEPLRVAIADAPVRRTRLVVGAYELTLPRPDATVALRLTDILGDQATVLIKPNS